MSPRTHASASPADHRTTWPRIDLPADFADPVPVAEDELAAIFRTRRARGDRASVLLTVYRAPVADRQQRRRLRAAILAAKRLDGLPALLAPTEAGYTAQGRPYVVTDPPSGHTLSGHLAEHGPLPVSETVRLGLQLAQALESMHDAEMLHLDVRPENIWLDESGALLLQGAGVLRALRTVTALSLPPESLVHAPRELFGWQTPSPATDVHQLGSTLHTLLTGHPPYAAQAALGHAALYQAVLQGGPTRPVRPDLPDALSDLLQAMMAVDPAHRPPLPEALETLRAYVDAPVPEPVPLAAPGEPETEVEAEDETEPEVEVARASTGAREVPVAPEPVTVELPLPPSAPVETFTAAAMLAALTEPDSGEDPSCEPVSEPRSTPDAEAPAPAQPAELKVFTPRRKAALVGSAAALAIAATVTALVATGGSSPQRHTGSPVVAGNHAAPPDALAASPSATSASATAIAAQSSAPSGGPSSPASNVPDARRNSTAGAIPGGNGQPATSRSTPGAAPAGAGSAAPVSQSFVLLSGPSCGASSMSLYGSWSSLSGSAVDGCADGSTRKQTGNHGNADWIFNPGKGRSCVFRIYVPDSSSITTISAHYQLFDNPDNHSDKLHEHYMAQDGWRGDWIVFNSTPISSSTGTFDLQLYDDRDLGTVEAADAVTATCS